METTKQKSLNNNVLPFILFALGAFFVFVNFYTSSTVLPLYIEELKGTEFDIGLQTILFYLTSILCRFYFGPLTDRKGRKIPLSIGAFIFCTAPLLFWISKDVNILLFARIYQAVGMAAFFSSAATLAADFAPPGRMGLFMGLYRLLFTLALLSGPSAALGIIKLYDYKILFLLCFSIGLVALVIILFVNPPGGLRNTETNTIQTMKQLVRSRRLYPIFIGYALITAGYGIIITFVILYISRFNQYNNPGIYFTYFCAAGVVTSLAAGYWSDRVGRQSIAWPAVLFMGVGMMLLYPIPSLPVTLIISGVATGIGFSAGVAVFMAWLIDETDEKVKGTVLAIQECVFDLFFGFGSFLFGLITMFIKMDLAFFLSGIGVFGVAMVFLWKARRISLICNSDMSQGESRYGS